MVQSRRVKASYNTSFSEKQSTAVLSPKMRQNLLINLPVTCFDAIPEDYSKQGSTISQILLH